MHLISVKRCSCNEKSLQFSESQVFLLPLSSSEHWVPIFHVQYNCRNFNSAHIKYIAVLQELTGLRLQVWLIKNFKVFKVSR